MTLGELVGSLLPLALGVALSPFPIVGVVVVLGTRRGPVHGAAFAVGWVTGLTAVAAVVVLLAARAGSPGGTRNLVQWLTLAVGVALVGLAVRRWRARPGPDDEPEAPAWLDRVDGLGAAGCGVLGLALSAANPKNLALTAAAAGSVASSGAGEVDELVAVALYVALASAVVVGLVVLRTVAGARADAPLDRIRAAMVRHAAAIMAVVLLLLGAKLIGDALGALTA